MKVLLAMCLSAVVLLLVAIILTFKLLVSLFKELREERSCVSYLS